MNDDDIERAWNDAHADLLILCERDRVKVRDFIADFGGGDYNTADELIGRLRRMGFEIVNTSAVWITPQAAAAFSAEAPR